MPKPPDLTATSSGNKRLWNTYMFWARSMFPDPIGHLDIANPDNRIDESPSVALRAIMFAALLLEYRLKATCEFVGVLSPAKETLGPLINNFKARIETGTRLDNQRSVRLPREWSDLQRKLTSLATLRISWYMQITATCVDSCIADVVGWLEEPRSHTTPWWMRCE